MVFTSTQYLLFLPIVVLLYYILPHRYRWGMLLAASFYFYACWSLWMVPWLLMVIAIYYTAGLLIAPEERSSPTDVVRRKWGIVLGCGTLVGALILTKYSNFIIEQIVKAGKILHVSLQPPHVSVSAPVGISFFIFQSLGYIFDVYRKKVKVTTHLGKYALFIAFFPHLAEGPIDRANNLLPQFDEVHHFDYETARTALVLIFFGVFKKVVVADRLAVLVDTVFDNVGQYSGLSCWVAALFYSFQIYCDFSGYTDIALGSAGLMGFRLVENFNTPYLASSIADFWRRWHMSLSTWFRDYIYIPLGGSRVSEGRWALNVMIVFLISGIWHGAAWTFILWGVLHGLFQIIGKYKSRLIKKLIPRENNFVKGARVFITFFLVTLLWALFRSASIQDYWTLLKGMVSFSSKSNLLALGMEKNELILSFILIGMTMMFDLLHAKYKLPDAVERLPLPARWILYLLFLFAIILFGRYGSLTADSFIYFNF